MKSLQILTLLMLPIFFQACQQNQKTSASSDELPELLIRAKVIGPEEEMGYMLDQYQSLTSKIKANPADHSSHLALAELFMMEARISGEHGYYYPAALKIIANVLNQELSDPLKYRALLDKAAVLLSLHQFKEARQTGEAALALNATSADVYGVLVDASVELGDYQGAILYADKMAGIRPDLRSYSRVSYLREIHGLVRESIEAMKLAVAAGYPGMEQTEWARLTLGHLYERYGSLDSAMMQYQIALSERPNYPFAIAAMARIYDSKGDRHLADSLNEEARKLIPEVSFFVDKATWELANGNVANAEVWTKEILLMVADDEEAGHQMNLEMSSVYLHLRKDADQALIYALKEYADRPNNIDVNKMLAEIYYTQGDMQKTETHLKLAMQTGSNDPEMKCMEGILLAKNNHQVEGTKIIQAVFVDVPYLDCSFCKDAKAIIL